MRYVLPLSLVITYALTGCSEYDLTQQLDQVDDEEDTAAPYIDDGTTLGAPVAVCNAYPNPITPPYQPATWDGSESYDPQGGAIVSYNWELASQPAGATMQMVPTNTAIVSNFTPIIAGAYVGRLTVTNDQGESDTCEVTLDVVPTQALWIEMFWIYPGDDMDLHLVAPNGQKQTPGDCYYSNCRSTMPPLDWGQPGYPGDNPVLDFDDIPGVGPENINVDDPVNAEYLVTVHDYPGSVRTQANDVTINIYLEGVLKWTDTRTIVGEDTFTDYARVNPVTGTITPL